MHKSVRLILAGAAFGLALNLLPPPARAQLDSDTTQTAPYHATKTVPHKHKRVRRHKKTRARPRSKSSTKSHVRTAQVYLDELGYNPGPADGIIGSRTRAALKAFQNDHHLKATGTLTDKTYSELVKEAGSRNPERSSAAPQPNFFTAHPDFYGYYGPDYSNPTILGSPQPIPSRYGTIDVSDQPNGSTHNYVVNLNGQMVFHADNQASPMNVSRTFNLDGADAVLITSYAPGNSLCPYKHNLLVVRAQGSGVYPVNNCTRNYQAYTENGMLTISFPGDHTDGYSSGDVWRYDHGNLEKL